MSPEHTSDVRTLDNSELYAHLHTAVGRLLEHQKQGVGGRACPCDIDPWDSRTECLYRQEVAKLHAEVADRPDVIILDMSGPVSAPLVVPGGTVAIDSHTRDIVLTQDIDGKRRYIRWRWQDATTTGEALMLAARTVRDEPDPAKVQQLAALMSDFGDTNLVTLARHLLASGVQFPDAS
ncbi:hypothetical protein [Nonomuraea candida]|uniref:hypothetical protein n=1 Tax=Nonomuraea candida TaxID=359159 RepID=UPI0005B85FBA|nr:hypothetical protein [Nonomuraea candida]